MDVSKRMNEILGKILKRREGALALRMGDVKEVLLLRNKMACRRAARGIDVTCVPAFAWKRRRFRLRLEPGREPNPHIVIAGMSGFGKSSLFKHIVADFADARVPCIIFDAHNEHETVVRALGGTVYDARYTGINLMELDGATVGERIAELTGMFREVYSLGYIQATKLSQCLWYAYRKAGATDRQASSLERKLTIGSLLNELGVFVRNARSIGERNTLLHLHDRLSLLNSGAFSSSVEMHGLDSGVHSFSLAGMKSREAQVIYIGELLRRIYQRMHSNSKEQGLRMCIAIDEAQFLTGSSDASSGLIRSLIEEGRKYGVCVMVVTHAASGLSRQIVANASTLVAFYAREPSEASYVAKLIAGNDQQRAYAVMERMRRLRQNEAIVISCNSRDPLLVATPDIAGLNERLKNLSPGDGQPHGTDAALLSDTRKPTPYDKAVKEHGVGEVDALLKKGALSKFSVSPDGKDEMWLMAKNGAVSIEHEVCVRKIHELLERSEIRNYVTGGKGPDIVALCNDGKIAVEYETGRKKLKESAAMIESRRKEYDRVVIFANSKAYRFYKNYFECSNVMVFDIRDVHNSAATLHEICRGALVPQV